MINAKPKGNNKAQPGQNIQPVPVLLLLYRFNLYMPNEKGCGKIFDTCYSCHSTFGEDYY